jgi:hypothetical protein
LVSRGNLALGGLENVGEYVGGALLIPFSAGRYSVTVHLIDWKADPESTTSDGHPTEASLPDFVVEIHPESNLSVAYRSSAEAFSR